MWHEQEWIWNDDELYGPTKVRFYVEKVRANTRTFMVRPNVFRDIDFIRMKHPDLVFVTILTYPKKTAMKNGCITPYLLRHNGERLMRVHLPHTFNDGTVCVGYESYDQIQIRAATGKPPGLASVFFNTAFRTMFSARAWIGRELHPECFISRMWDRYEEFRAAVRDGPKGARR